MTPEDDVNRRPLSSEEELAAFLEGKLTPEHRARVLRRAAEDTELYELLAESAAVVESLGDVAPTQPGHRSAFRRWRWPVIGLAAAASIAAVVSVRVLHQRSASATGLLAMSARVRLGAMSPATLLQPPWQEMRGGEAVGEPLRLRRAGARLADLTLATAAADASTAGRVSLDVARELDGLLAAAPVVAELRAASARAAQGRTGWPEAIRRAAGDAGRVFDSPELRLGVWAETVRLAVLFGDTAALSSAPLGAAGRRLAADGGPNADRVKEVLHALEAKSPPDTAFLLDRLEALLRGP